MDPNACLKEILRLSHSVAECGACPSSPQILANATDLAEAVLDLHEWLMKGGFLPDAWELRGIMKETKK